MLHKLVEFNVPTEDLLNIYVLYIRSVLEQSCQVWHSSLTAENITDLERVQKNSLKIILGRKYISYENALKITGIQSLFERREGLCLKFAKACLKNSQVKDIFPVNAPNTDMTTRNREKYTVTFARSERLRTSAVPHMQRLLNGSSN